MPHVLIIISVVVVCVYRLLSFRNYCYELLKVADKGEYEPV